jgi:hypothetical protein
MIPEFDLWGTLPEGVHYATWSEFKTRFGYTAHRLDLIELLAKLARHLAEVGCATLYVDGSFVTQKAVPNDYDACWDSTGVKHDRLDPVLLRADAAGKAMMAARYGGDIRIANLSFGDFDGIYLDFFQTDRDGRKKGIVALDLHEFLR